ncbi:MAG: hypothetical protein WCK75_08625 [Elusimicrobiota bacterium]
MKRYFIAAIISMASASAVCASESALSGLKSASPLSALENISFETPKVVRAQSEIAAEGASQDETFKSLFFKGTPAPAAPSRVNNYSGEWGNKTYDFYFNDGANNIYGRWGDKDSDFYVRGDTGNIYGKISGKEFDFHVRPDTGNIYGTFPCGKTDIYYKVSSRNIYGTLCGKAFDSRVGSEEEVIPAAKALFQSEITRYLPGMLDAPVRKFIDGRIEL